LSRGKKIKTRRRYDAQQRLPKPDYATSNMRSSATAIRAGRCDGVQIMVHRGYAYIGHIFSKGFTVVDVRDPSSPKVVKYVAAPLNHMDAPPAGFRRPAPRHSQQRHVRPA